MALAKAESRLSSPSFWITTIVTLLLVGVAHTATAGGATSAALGRTISATAGGVTSAITAATAKSSIRPAPILSPQRDMNRLLLPGRVNPADIVQQIRRNRDTALTVPPMPVNGLPVNGAGVPFLIGSGPETAPDDQRLPAVAFDGTNYLVVWEDRRTGSTDLYCARVSPNGEVLDPRGIVISAEHNAQGTPAVAFDGTNFLVVWDDWRFSMNPNIYGARVSPAGTLLDSIAIPVSTAIDGQINPSIAFDGTNYLVVWEDWRSGTRTPDIYCTRVSPSGDVLDSAGVVVSVAAGNQMYPAVAFNGANYVVVWEDQRNLFSDIYGARISPSGILLDPDGIAVSTGANLQRYPSVTCDGTNCLVVWEDQRNLSSDIYGARISPSGTVADPAGIAISTATGDQMRPTLVFDGAGYFVLWEDWRNDGAGLYGARVSTGGVPSDIGMIASEPMSDPGYTCPSIGFDGVNYLVTWEGYGSEPSSTDLYGARVNSSGDLLQPGVTVISTEARWQDHPAVSSDGTNYLAVWTDYDTHFYDSEIRGRRVSADGTPFGSNIIISPTGASLQTLPAVAFDGRNYLVVWLGNGSGGYGLYGARVDTSGSILDPDGILITTQAIVDWEAPAIAFGGTSYLVAWVDGRNGIDPDIYGTRIDTSGAVLDPEGIPISTQPGWDEFPDVAFDGTNYMVVWDDERSGAPRVYAMRVDATGTMLDPGGIAVSAGSDYEGIAALAFDGANYMVIWTRVLGDEYDICGARMTPSGTVLDPDGIPISISAGIQISPAVAFDGTKYQAVWSDFENWLDPVEVYGTRIDTSGTVLDPAGVRLGGSAAWVDESFSPQPSIARGPLGSVLVSYSAFTGTPYDCNRIWGSEPDWLTTLTFSSVAASGKGGYVKVSWQMAVDVPVLSFQIWRSDSPEAGFSRMNLTIVEDTRNSFHCVDRTVIPGRTYWYKVSLQGSSVEESSGLVEVFVEPMPLAFRLRETFPNPSNPSCTIRYEVPRTCEVSLRMFDLSGRVIRTLVDTWKEPGTYAEFWDGRNDSGETLPSGVYLCRFEADTFTATEKIVLVR